jgi:nucleoside-diphosphate-sugar epimerase
MESEMNKDVVVIGYGPVGRAVVAQLLAHGSAVRIAQRTRPADLPQAVPFVACDVLDAASVQAAVAGASQVVVAIGFQYDGKVWERDWPLAMTNMLDACADAGARMVFVDNLYMYGPQTTPLREDMALTDHGDKPKARAEVTRIWQAAAAAGRVKVAALRSPDFYGPGVTLSHLGDLAFGSLGRGKAAQMIVPPDTLHDFAYVPDIAAAVLLLLDAPDADFNQAWHTPSAPTTTPRQIIALGATAIGARPRIFALPLWLQPVVGLFMPMLKAMREMRFQWDRPYIVDSSRFARRFNFVPTPFAIGAAETARSFQGSVAAPVLRTAVHA